MNSIEVFNDVIQNLMIRMHDSSAYDLGNSLTYTVFPVVILSVARLVVSKNCDESSRNFLVEFILEKKA